MVAFELRGISLVKLGEGGEGGKQVHLLSIDCCVLTYLILCATAYAAN